MSGIHADLILSGGAVRTMCGPAEVHEAIAVSAGRILAVGRWAELTDLAGPDTRVRDLDGATVLPGFIDAHVHLESAITYDESLVGVVDKAGTLSRVRDRLRIVGDGEWLICRGDAMERHCWPTRHELDVACGGIRTILSVGAGTYVLSSSALIEVDRSTVRSLGATLDEQGWLTMRTASGLQKVLPTAPLYTRDIVRSSLLRGMHELRKGGVTTAHHIVKDHLPLQIYQEMAQARELPMRVGLLLRCFDSDMSLDAILSVGMCQPFGDDFLRIQGLKISVDGYFPARTAAFTEDYYDDPGNNGKLHLSYDELAELVDRAHSHGYRMCLHANGDRAAALCMDAFEQALTRTPRADHRHRIEHAGNIYYPEHLLARMAASAIVAVPNPAFLSRRVEQVASRLGPERSGHPLNVRALLDAGVLVAVGSDFTGIRPPTPLIGIAALVTRRAASGTLFASDQAVSVWEALQLHTVAGAWVGFEEDVKGTLEVGKLADFAILDRDPMNVPVDEIAEITVLDTIVGGRSDTGPAY